MTSIGLMFWHFTSAQSTKHLIWDYSGHSEAMEEAPSFQDTHIHPGKPRRGPGSWEKVWCSFPCGPEGLWQWLHIG